MCLALILVLALLPTPSVLCLQLDSDGGYHIVVAIADSDVSPMGNGTEAGEYINSVKEMLNNFAAILWAATNSVFFLKSAQLLLPASWSTKLGFEANVSMATYVGADVQISGDTDVPVAENYYPCGTPGVRIRLPVWFLDANRTRDEFGSQSKGLLNLWLRYRFGVWEEHGYPGHPITPYFYRPNVVEEGPVPALWRVTSCNASELLGELSPVNRNSSRTCDLHDFDALDKSCRFHPGADVNEKNVRTSLMNFQWVESLQGLCDEGTHDTRAPNRQNLYCDFRSVWEVIRSSQDFRTLKKEATGMSSTMPSIRYDVVIPNSKPVLYILFDLSDPDFTWRDNVYNMWMVELEAFVNALPSDVYVSLTIYPNLLDPSTDLERKLNWTLLDEAKRGELLRILDFVHHTEHELTKYFDFRLPLAEVLSELKQTSKSSPNGTDTLLLVLRTEQIPLEVFMQFFQGPAPYEEDFVVELRQHGISLFALEANLVFDENNPNMTLEYLATISGGMYSELTSKDPSDEEMAGMRSVFMSVLDRLSGDAKVDVHAHEVYEVIYKELLTNVSQKSVFIPQPSVCAMEIVHIYVTVAGGTGARLEKIELLLPGHDNSAVPFTSRREWFPSVSVSGEEEKWATILPQTYSTIIISEFQEPKKAEPNGASFWELRVSLVRDTSEFGEHWGLGSMRGVVTVYGVKAPGYRILSHKTL